MPWHGLLTLLVLGSMALGGSAAALTIAKLDPDAVLGAREEPGACAPTGCLHPVQMPMWPFGGRDAVGTMPADQRELLTRLLSPELSEVVSQAERQILSQALDRGDRLSAEAVRELSAMLRDKQGQQAQRLATAKAEAERQRQAELAAAEAERQRDREQAAAEAERQREREQAAAEAERRRQAELARADADRQRQGQAQTAAEAERLRQTEQDAAEAERQRQAKLAAADAERQRQAAAAAEAERQRQAQLAAAEAERERQAAEAAQALAEAKREAARLVYHDEFPPLRPL